MSGAIILAYLNFFLWLHLATVFLWARAEFIRKWWNIVIILMWCAWSVFIFAHLLLQFLTVIVPLVVLLLFADGQTWRRRGTDDDIRRCHITRYRRDICTFYSCFTHSSEQRKTWTSVRWLYTFHILRPRQDSFLSVCVCFVPTYLELFIGEPHRWMMRSYIPCSHGATRNAIILFAAALSLSAAPLSVALYWSAERKAWRDQKTQERRTVSGCRTTPTMMLQFFVFF